MYYERLAAMDDDPDALGIVGLAPFLFFDDLAARDTLPLVSLRQGAELLQRSADLGCDRAQFVIECLQHQGLWEPVAPAPGSIPPVWEYISPLYYDNDSILALAKRAYIDDNRQP